MCILHEAALYMLVLQYIFWAELWWGMGHGMLAFFKVLVCNVHQTLFEECFLVLQLKKKQKLAVALSYKFYFLGRLFRLAPKFGVCSVNIIYFLGCKPHVCFQIRHAVLYQRYKFIYTNS